MTSYELFQEDGNARKHVSKDWITSPSFRDELLDVAVTLSISIPWTLRQLTTIGVEWERKQQLKTLKGEQRDYQLVYQNRGPDNRRFMADLTAVMFGEDDLCSHTLYDHKTEHRQLEVYLSISKAGAAGDALVLQRVLNYPYVTQRVVSLTTASFSRSLASALAGWMHTLRVSTGIIKPTSPAQERKLN